MTYRCKNCGAPLAGVPEREAEDWIILCLVCGAKNVLQAVVQIVGWRP